MSVISLFLLLPYFTFQVMCVCVCSLPIVQACQVSLSLSEPAKEVMKLMQNAQLSWSNAGMTVTRQKSSVALGVVFNLQGWEK